MQTALIQRIRLALAALLVLCLMSALPALAVETPVMAQISISPEELSVPGPVDVSIGVTNISGADLTRPVTLYDPNGKIVSGFGQNGSATLKADAQMSRVMEELSSTENRIAFARQAYNDAVTEYNTKRELFPTSIVAGMFNFDPAALLESTDSAAQREAPQVKF